MDRSGISPFPTGPYIEGLAGKLDRKPTIALFRQVDKRGSRVEDDRDQYDPDRQFCAQLLCLFLARERNPGAEQSIGADELDKLYHDNTVFPADGPSARRFAMVLEHTTQVFIHTLLKNVSAKFNLTSPFPTSPIQTASKFRKKFKKLDIIATVFLIQDLTHLPNMKLDLSFYRKLAHHLSAEQEVGAGGKSTSGPTIARYYAEWRKTNPDIGIHLDQKRCFDDGQKILMLQRQNGRCLVCGEELVLEEAEGDHYPVPHRLGGPTTLENGRLVHKNECHPRGRPAAQSDVASGNGQADS